jgi:hypothetical protein
MSLLSTVGRKHFWTDYLFVLEGDSSQEYPELDRCRIQFEISTQYGLVLQIDERLSEATLFLKHPDARKPVQIAWDDQAHWHPHVLRWDELESICRGLAMREPYFAHPGLPLLLLNRFAPVTVGDDATTIFQVLEQAWRSLNLFDNDEMIKLARRFDFRCAGFIWRADERYGWIIQQDHGLRQETGYLHNADLYTLRHPDNQDFPFEHLNRLVDEARRLTSRLDPRQ